MSSPVGYRARKNVEIILRQKVVEVQIVFHILNMIMSLGSKLIPMEE